MSSKKIYKPRVKKEDLQTDLSILPLVRNNAIENKKHVVIFDLFGSIIDNKPLFFKHTSPYPKQSNWDVSDLWYTQSRRKHIESIITTLSTYEHVILHIVSDGTLGYIGTLDLLARCGFSMFHDKNIHVGNITDQVGYVHDKYQCKNHSYTFYYVSDYIQTQIVRKYPLMYKCDVSSLHDIDQYNRTWEICKWILRRVSGQETSTYDGSIEQVPAIE